MLKHGRAGVPMEVMGLMLGEFVDDYTVRVIDVFAMPQSGTVIYNNLKENMLLILKLFRMLFFLKFKGCERRSSRFSISNKNVRYAETNWKV
jgi:hypothetical protein